MGLSRVAWARWEPEAPPGASCLPRTKQGPVVGACRQRHPDHKPTLTG